MRYKTLITERLESSLNALERVITGIETSTISPTDAVALLKEVGRKIEYVSQTVELEPEE